jgi:hypothetical protein
MENDVERELKEIENLIEEWERSRNQDSGDEPDSSVPASLRPKPSGNRGAIVLPQPEEND